MEPYCYSSIQIKSDINQCQRSTNQFVSFFNNIIDQAIQPKQLYLVLFGISFMFDIEIFNYIVVSTLFMTISLIVGKKFQPICSCLDGNYGKLIFDPLSVHVLTFVGVLSQSKQYQFSLDQKIVLIVSGIITSISVSLSTGNLSVFTMLVTYAEILVLACLVPLYPIINTVCSFVGIILSIVAVVLNLNEENDMKILSYIMLMTTVMNLCVYLVQDIRNWRKLFTLQKKKSDFQCITSKELRAKPAYSMILHFFMMTVFVFSFAVWGGISGKS